MVRTTARQPLKLFSWGYAGWGNSIPQLLRVTAAAERERGFKPPVFVDVRFNRSVRAQGFRDHAFEAALPPDRYRWMQGLGNERIATRGLKIHKPGDAGLLLELALEEHEHHRRLIFFCSCGSPERCHRNQVRTLVLKAAKKRSLNIEIAEWPGGEPSGRHTLSLPVPPKVFTGITRGGARIPVPEEVALRTCASLPWGSYVDLSDGVRRATVAVGPAQFSAGEWHLEVFINPVDEGDEVRDLVEAVRKARRELNYGIFRQP